jgi:hypothetical protein
MDAGVLRCAQRAVPGAVLIGVDRRWRWLVDDACQRDKTNNARRAALVIGLAQDNTGPNARFLERLSPVLGKNESFVKRYNATAGSFTASA